MIFTMDYYGGARYPDLILREHPRAWGARFIWELDGFGKARDVVAEILAKHAAPQLGLHLIWKDDHNFTERDIPTAVKRAKEIVPFIKKYKDVDFTISPCLEHRMNLALTQKFYKAIIGVVGAVRYVNSPLREGALLPGAINEFHGMDGEPRCGGRTKFSFDGISAVDNNVPHWLKTFAGVETFSWWIPQFNCKKNTADKTPRKDRKAIPTSGLIDSVVYLAKGKGDPRLPDRFIWKSHADQHNAPKPEDRAHKPVLICPPSAARAELVADNGQVVAVSYQKGTFTDKRPLYRFSDYGFQIAEKAVRIQGNPVLKLRIGGKVYGTVNPAHRQNDYRNKG